MAIYDQTWKEAMNQWFEPFVAFFFPNIHRDIDWSRGWESLDKEFQQIVREAEQGDKRADKLVKVWRRSGEEAWLLIHVEFQSRREADFERRMFVYHYRIFDLYNLQVVSLAVLGDGDRHWLPEAFAYDAWGCELSFRFPIVKLLTLANMGQTLETSSDPMTAMVLAHLATLEQPNDDLSVFARERRVIRSLYQRGMEKQMILDLFRVIHRMMDLPKELASRFIHEHFQWEGEQEMPYMLDFEREAMERGEAKGKAEGKAEGQAAMLMLLLEQRFGAPLPQELATRIRATLDTALLEQWATLLFAVASLDEFRQKM